MKDLFFLSIIICAIVLVGQKTITNKAQVSTKSKVVLTDCNCSYDFNENTIQLENPNPWMVEMLNEIIALDSYNGDPIRICRAEKISDIVAGFATEYEGLPLIVIEEQYTEIDSIPDRLERIRVTAHEYKHCLYKDWDSIEDPYLLERRADRGAGEIFRKMGYSWLEIATHFGYSPSLTDIHPGGEDLKNAYREGWLQADLEIKSRTL